MPVLTSHSGGCRFSPDVSAFIMGTLVGTDVYSLVGICQAQLEPDLLGY